MWCQEHFGHTYAPNITQLFFSNCQRSVRQCRVLPDLRQLIKDLKQYRGVIPKNGRFGSGRVREDLLALVHWIIEGDGKKNPVYPFSLSHLEFFQRCKDAMRRADIWIPTPRSQPERRALSHLGSLMRRLEKDKRFNNAVGRLEKGWQAFTDARNALRLTDSELPRGDKRYQQVDLPALEAQRLKEIETEVVHYLDGLHEQVGDDSLTKPTTPHAIILKYFNKYRDHLFGHPVIRNENGAVIAVVERTNNVDERFFGKEKQQLRRRLGRAHLGHDLEDQPAQAALAANLCHPDYIRILCGSLDNLHNEFADLDKQALDKATPLVRSNRDTALQKRIRVLIENFADLHNNDKIKPDFDKLSD